MIWEEIEDLQLKRLEAEDLNHEDEFDDNDEFLDSFFDKVKLVDTPPTQVKFGLHSVPSYNLMINFIFFAEV